MGTFESINIETMETPKVEVETSENLRRETPEIKNKWFYLGIPAIAIAFAEMMDVFGKDNRSCMAIHAVILLGLSFSTMFVKNEEIQKTYQALILLPILRLVNLSMPVFYEATALFFYFHIRSPGNSCKHCSHPSGILLASSLE